MKIHKTVQHYSTEKFNCEECGKSFGSKGYLRKHEYTHRKVDGQISCAVCQMQFKQNVDLQIHEKRKHKEESSMSHTCSVCNKEFQFKEYLKRHHQVHSVKPNRKCLECHKCFKFPEELTSHMVSHSTERPFQCEICDKSFKRKHELKLHRLTHTREKVHQCSFCQNLFARKNSLLYHERGHTGEKPFKCVLCEKQFKRKDVLNNHVRKLHNGKQ